MDKYLYEVYNTENGTRIYDEVLTLAELRKKTETEASFNELVQNGVLHFSSGYKRAMLTKLTYAPDAPKTNDHYYVDVSGLEKIDFYVIARLYRITDPNIQHTVKKLLALGKRSGGKTETQDIQDCIASLQRKLDIDKQFLDIGLDK